MRNPLFLGAFVLLPTINFHFPLLSKPTIGVFSSGCSLDDKSHYSELPVTFKLSPRTVVKTTNETLITCVPNQETGIPRAPHSWWQGPWLLEAPKGDSDQAETSLEVLGCISFL